MNPSERVEVLLNTYLFQDLLPTHLTAFAAAATTLSVDAGSAVYRAGDDATHLYALARGRVKESVVTAEGDELVFEILESPSLFGEPALFTTERVRAVDVVAMEAAVVICIERKALIALLVRHPPAMLRALEGLAAAVMFAVDDQVSLAHLSIEHRLLTKLVELGEAAGSGIIEGPRVLIKLDQSTLAASIGASRENVNRRLAALAASGLLEVDRGGITLTDLGRLRGLRVGWSARARRNRRF